MNSSYLIRRDAFQQRTLDALVQQLSILAGLNYVQSAHMTYQAVSKGMVTEVLTILISIVLFLSSECAAK